MAPGGGADLVVRVAANIESLKADMSQAATSIKQIETSTKTATEATSKWSGALEELGNSFGIHVAEGMLIRDVTRYFIDFGKEVLEAGDHIQKMADQTSLTTDEVQRFAYIAGQAGTSTEGLIGAVQNLQVRLGDEKTGAAGALDKLNINLAAFKSLDPYEQMVSLSEAIRGVEDPTQRASLESALFGKTWKEIGPAILSDMRAIGDEAPVMSDDTVKSLDKIGDAMKRAHQQAIAWGGGVVVAIEGAGFAVGDFLSTFDPAHFGVANSTILALQKEINDPDGLKGALASVKPPALAVADAFEVVGISADDAKAAEKELTESARELMKVNAEMAKAMLDLDSVGDNWHKTLDRIDGSVVEAIKYYLAAGVSQQSLAVAYGLTAEQIHSVADARKEDIATCQAEEKILAEFEQAQIDQSTSETAAIEKVASAIDGEAGAVHTLAGEWIAAAAAKASFDMGNTLDVAHAARDPEIMNLLHMGWSLENAQAIQLGRQWGFTPKLYSPTGALESQPDPRERVPGYITGTDGFVDFGAGTLAMLHGREAIVPESAVSGGGGVIGGTTTITNHIYVNGTGADVARQVMAEITRTMKQTRQWPAA